MTDSRQERSVTKFDKLITLDHDQQPCHKCGLLFQGKKELESHQLDTHDSPCYCSICDKRFQSLPGYIGHRTIHESFVKNFTHLPKCDICGKVCLKKSHLESHMQRHSVTRSFTCPKCGKSYKHESSLMRHMHEIHKETNEMT